MKRKLLLSMLVFLVAANFAWGQMISQTISYQGVLTDAGGTVVPDGTYQLSSRFTTPPQPVICFGQRYTVQRWSTMAYSM